MYAKIKKFLWNNKCTLILMFSLFLYAFDASAATFDALKNAGENIKSGLFYIIPRAATIGIACICIGGMFGNFNWKWFAAIAIGLFVIAMYSGVERFVTGEGYGSTETDLNGEG